MAVPPASAKMDAKRSEIYPLVLLAAFLVWWGWLAISPWYREDWLLENVLVFIMVPVLIWSYRNLRFSNGAYTCLFLFLLLHEVGAHYTYSEVPYDDWSRALFGNGISEALGLERNHYDRLVHFLYGVLIAPAAIELLDARAPQQGMWQWLLPWFFMVSHSTLFETVEAAAAGVFGGELGMAYLGTQGDEWDAHKDSALAAVGAAIAISIYRLWAPIRHSRRQQEVTSV